MDLGKWFEVCLLGLASFLVSPRLAGQTTMKDDFVQRKGQHFVWRGEAYYFLGTNFWYGMHLGAHDNPQGQARLIRELDALQVLGLKNLRIMAAFEGPDDAPWRLSPALQVTNGVYREKYLEGLDFLLDEMAKRDMLAVVCLNNFWPWSGGMAQYLDWAGEGPIPYPPPAEGGSWSKFALFSSRFYKNPQALKAYESFVRMIILRTNSISGRAYLDDPTIMAWELANEPRGMLRARAYRKWIARSASLIKSLDPHHLLTIGSEGRTTTFLSGTHFKRDHSIPGIDYATLHIWAQNWGWYDPLRPEQTYEKAEKKALKYLHKHLRQLHNLDLPIVLEEFGLARDGNSHDPLSPVTYRDRYFERIFDEVSEQCKRGTALAGANIWAWGGEGRPRKAAAIWQVGDELIGDPPHEHQGWYSIYDQDLSTHSILKKHAKKMMALGK